MEGGGPGEGKSMEEGTWTILNNDFFPSPEGEITLVASIKRKEKETVMGKAKGKRKEKR